MKINPYFIAFAIGLTLIAIALGAMHGWPAGVFVMGVALVLVGLRF